MQKTPHPITITEGKGISNYDTKLANAVDRIQADNKKSKEYHSVIVILMLNIDKGSIKVCKQSIFPAITFTVVDNQLEEDTIPVRIDGIVLSMDWKYITDMVELPDAQVRNNPMVDGRSITHTSKITSFITSAVYDKNTDIINNNPPTSKIKKSFKTYRRDLIFTLNDRILEHIENLRQQQKNKDIVLYFIFRTSYLRHFLKLGLYAPKFIKHNSDDDDVIIFSNALRENNKNDSVNLKILVNEDKENRLLYYIVDEFRRQVIIPSNEWADNFQQSLINFNT